MPQPPPPACRRCLIVRLLASLPFAAVFGLYFHALAEHVHHKRHPDKPSLTHAWLERMQDFLPGVRTCLCLSFFLPPWVRTVLKQQQFPGLGWNMGWDSRILPNPKQEVLPGVP